MSTTTANTTTTTAFDDPPTPVGTKLAASWTSFMFLYIYVDYLTLYKPGVIDGIRDGWSSSSTSARPSSSVRSS